MSKHKNGGCHSIDDTHSLLSASNGHLEARQLHSVGELIAVGIAVVIEHHGELVGAAHLVEERGGKRLALPAENRVYYTSC